MVTLSLPVPPQPVITSISNVTESATTDNITVQWTFGYNVVSPKLLDTISTIVTPNFCHTFLVNYISNYMAKLSMGEHLNVSGCVYTDFS